MTQPIETKAADVAEFSNPLHDIAKAAFALSKEFLAKPGDGNANSAFQALIMARLIAAAHEVSQAGGAPERNFGQAHYCYRNAAAFVTEAAHMINHGGELLGLDRAFCVAPPKTRDVPAWWLGKFKEGQTS